MNCLKRLRTADGVSLVEVIVSIILLTIVVTSLAQASFIAARYLQQGKSDTRMWSAVHFQMESITADGYDALSSGSSTVEGYPMTWAVQGVYPKKVILEVTTSRFGTSTRDTFVTYIADFGT